MLNNKLIRDILDVCEGYIRNILNSQNNYNHSTLKYNAHWISLKASQIKKEFNQSECLKKTHREHAIPLKLLISQLYSFESLEIKQLKEFLNKNLISVLITKDERDDLDQGVGNLKDSMPKDWDNQNVFARFDNKNIKIQCIGTSNSSKMAHD